MLNKVKMCLVQDDSSHWYCIPVNDREAFERWADDSDDDTVLDFDEYRLNMHVSNYCFENFKEIK